MELRCIFQRLWRRRWLAICVFASIFLTIILGTLLITPSYDATAKVLLRKSAASYSLLSSLNLQSINASQTTSFSTTDQADYLVLSTSKPLIEKVISDLQIKRLRVRGKVLKTFPFLKPILKALGVDVESVEELMTAEDLLKDSLITKIFPRPNVQSEQYEETDVIEIQAKSTDPKEAKEIANAVALGFIEEEKMRIREDYRGARYLIEGNANKAKQEYQKVVNNLKEFKTNENLLNVDLESQSLITMVYTLKNEMDDNELLLHKTQNVAKKIELQLKSMPKYQKASERIKENETITPLKNVMRDLYISLAESKTKYTADHPAVIEIKNKISEAKEILQNEMAKVFGDETTSIDPVYQDLTGKLAEKYSDIVGFEVLNQAYPKIIKKYEVEIASMSRKSAEHAQLQQVATVAQEVYDSLLKTLYQIEMAESTALANIYLIEPAVVPKVDDSKHKHPSIGVNAIIALLLGTSLGVVGALFLDYMDNSIRSPDDEVFINLPLLGRIFRLRRGDIRTVHTADPKSSLLENFRTIKNSIKYATAENPPKSISIISSINGEGKSFVASNLAILLANEGKKVLVMDGNLRNPSLHTIFNLVNEYGLVNFLTGEKDAHEIQMATSIEGLTVMPSGPLPTDPAKLVESEKMHQVIKNMEDVYDLVIVDTPPMLSTNDAIQLANWTGCTISITESEKTNRKHLLEMILLVKQAKINHIGTVLNKVERDRDFYLRYAHEKKLLKI